MTGIASYTFYRCAGLNSIVIPSSMRHIGKDATNGCTNLTDVYFGGTEEDWNNITIMDNNVSLSGATIHYESTGPAANGIAMDGVSELGSDELPLDGSADTLPCGEPHAKVDTNASEEPLPVDVMSAADEALTTIERASEVPVVPEPAPLPTSVKTTSVASAELSATLIPVI